MTSSKLVSVVRTALAPSATFISGLAVVATLVLPGTAFAAPTIPSFPTLPPYSMFSLTPTFTTTITVTPVTSPSDATATLSATLNGTLKDFGLTYNVPIPNQTLIFSINGTPEGTAQTNSNGVATIPNVDLTGFTSPATITVTYAGVTYDISSLIHFTLPALKLPGATGTGTLTLTTSGPINPLYVLQGADDSVANGTQTHPFPTIAEAINTAVSGDTIIVEAGSYPENVTVSKSLTFEGANSGVSATTTRSTESVVTGAFSVSADNVTIDGFTIDGPSSGPAINMDSGNAANNSGEMIENNIINAPGSAVQFNSSDTTITQNLINFSSTSNAGVQADNNPWSNLTVSDNTFTGAAPQMNADINFIGARSSVTPATANEDVTVTGNTSNDTSGTLLAAAFITGLTISDNTATNEAGSNIYLSGGNNGVTITGNTLTNGKTGINVTLWNDNTGTWPANTDVTASGNNFSGDTTGVIVLAGAISNPTVTATGNWWGDATGPNDLVSSDGSTPDTNTGTGSPAVGAVAYDGWCTVADCSTTYVTPTLTAPILVSPDNDSTTTNPAFDNTWDPVTGATAYEYQTSNTGDETGGVLNTIVFSDTSTSAGNYDLEPTLVTRHNNDGTPAGDYYWQVRAVDADGNVGPWSEIWKVTYQPQSVTPPSVPDAPTDLTAMFQYDSSDIANGSYLNITAKPGNNNLELEWTAPSGDITGYQIRDTYPDGTTNIGYQGPNTNGWLLPNGFGQHGDGAYTYQVVAVNAEGDSVPSETFTINYDATAPVVTVTPVAGSTLKGTVTFDITINDANPATTTNKSIWVYLYDNAGGQKSKGAKVDLSSGTGTFTVDTTLLDDGAATLDVGRLEDAASNFSGSGDTYFKNYVIDNTVVTPPAPTSVTVSIDAFVNGQQATAGNSDSVAFPMHAIFPGGEGDYTLNASGFGTTTAYEAMTSDMSTGSDYSTFESDAGHGQECTASFPFKLAGYGTGSTLADAESATPSMTVPAFTNLTSDEYVVASFTTCPPAPTNVTPATDGMTVTNAELPAIVWSAVTDPAGVVSYNYENSYSSAVNSDGSFTTPNWQTSGLTSPENSNANGTPDGTYYWEEQAVDAAGNVGPWSTPESVTISDNGGGNVNPPAPTPSVMTDAATYASSTDATLNGTNGSVAATGSSFWVSTQPFTVASTDAPVLPSNVYSTLDLGAQATGSNYNALLSSLVNAAYPNAMPAVVADTTYYYAAWVNVGGTWYPGAVQSFITSNTDNGASTTPASTTPSVTTNAATNVTSTDAVLNGTNGPVAADAESFWVSTSTIDTSDPLTIPAGVYSTPVITPGADAGATFMEHLSDVTTQGVPGNMDAIQPNTTYNYVAWSHVNGNWYHGDPQTVTTTLVTALPPTAHDISGIDVPENSSITITFTSDVQGGTGTYATTTSPTHGTLGPISGNSVVYTPDTNYAGPGDTFDYTVSNGGLTSNPATVNIVVTPGQTQASTVTADDQTATSTDDGNVTITLTGTTSGTSSLTFSTTTSPTQGTLGTINGDQVTYTPNSGATGSDSFQFVATDGTATSSAATVTINFTTSAPAPQTQNFPSSNFFGGGGGGGGQFVPNFNAGGNGGTGGNGGVGSTGQVLGASTYNFTKDLKVGSTGEDVTQLQLILIADGYLNITAPTGYFGQATKAAVMEYQAAENISPVSGYVGPITRAVLNAGTLPTTPH